MFFPRHERAISESHKAMDYLGSFIYRFYRGYMAFYEALKGSTGVMRDFMGLDWDMCQYIGF